MLTTCRHVFQYSFREWDLELGKDGYNPSSSLSLNLLIYIMRVILIPSLHWFMNIKLENCCDTHSQWDLERGPQEIKQKPDIYGKKSWDWMEPDLSVGEEVKTQNGLCLYLCTVKSMRCDWKCKVSRFSANTLFARHIVCQTPRLGLLCSSPSCWHALLLAFCVLGAGLALSLNVCLLSGSVTPQSPQRVHRAVVSKKGNCHHMLAIIDIIDVSLYDYHNEVP